jgi:hypothetical protein
MIDTLIGVMVGMPRIRLPGYCASPRDAERVRRRFRRRRPEVTATGELPEIPENGADPAEALDRGRQRRALLVALGELPDRERAIVSLRYGAGLNASETAAAVGHSTRRSRPSRSGLQGCAVPSARSCHGERGLRRHRATAPLVRARPDVSAETHLTEWTG